MPVISFTASMAAANPEAVPRKLRRDSLALAAQVSTRSLICSPMWPARKNEVPCSSGVIGPRVVRLYPLKYSKTLRSEEYTSELQSRQYLVCRLLLEKKKKQNRKKKKQNKTNDNNIMQL